MRSRHAVLACFLLVAACAGSDSDADRRIAELEREVGQLRELPDVAASTSLKPAADSSRSNATSDTPAATSATSSASTTRPAGAATTTADEGFELFTAAYDEGYELGYSDGANGIGEPPPWVSYEHLKSNDPWERGYAVGWYMGWDDGFAEWCCEFSGPGSQQVEDRGYERGWQDGYDAGYTDGWRGVWRANTLVVGQGPEYTDGFLEAYEEWFDMGRRRRQAWESNQLLNESLRTIDCLIDPRYC